MPTRLDDLFAGASTDPVEPPDPDRLWADGRRRRRWRQAGAVVGVVALLGVAGGVFAGLDQLGTPRIDAASPPEAVDEGEPPAAGASHDPLRERPEGLATRPTEDDTEPEDEPPPTDQAVEEEPDPGPQPDPEAVADPCAPHRGNEGQAFIDLVAPVDGQRVTGALELVGCASVYEATVRYRLRDADGQVLIDDFTTATAGGPEIGEFRETVLVELGGEFVLEVFWDSPADGSEADKTTVRIHAE